VAQGEALGGQLAQKYLMWRSGDDGDCM